MHTGELSFLNSIILPKAGYRSAHWLLTDFSDNEWSADFGRVSNTSWNFDVPLYDGSRLTDLKNAQLLDTLKQWLCIQAHAKVDRHQSRNSSTAKRRVTYTLHLIDYILLNGKQLEIGDHGLKLITENDIRTCIATFSSNAFIENSIYQWSHKLRDYLLSYSSSLSDVEVAKIASLRPEILVPHEVEDSKLELTQKQLIACRAWLWTKGCYREIATAEGPAFRANLAKCAAEIYSGTLWGKQVAATSKDTSLELDFGAGRFSLIEKRRVPTRNFEDERIDNRRAANYLASLRSLRVVCADDSRIPLHAFDPVEQDILKGLDLKEPGRNTMLPQKIVADALRNAIEFSLNYGEDLIDSYLKIVQSETSGKSSFYELIKDSSFGEVISPKLKKLGITTWSVSPFTFNGTYTGAPIQSHAEYFRLLRANYGLAELLKVLLGCIIICVGTLMARRIGELADLLPGLSLDESGMYLIFDNRKTGIYDLRVQEARPIPVIAVRLLQLLEKMHDGVKGTRFYTEAPLLSYPSRNTGVLTASPTRLYVSLDTFCDYFEIGGEDSDSRYYIRQHQLRQFFAIAFFWSSGFGGVDTLRWFLGHVDPRHIWNYITQATPGNILRHVRVEYAVQSLKRGGAETDGLADLLSNHFHTRDFAVFETSVLESYISQLIEDGVLAVEPEFITDDNGTRYKIIILVKSPME